MKGVEPIIRERRKLPMAGKSNKDTRPAKAAENCGCGCGCPPVKE